MSMSTSTHQEERLHPVFVYRWYLVNIADGRIPACRNLAVLFESLENEPTPLSAAAGTSASSVRCRPSDPSLWTDGIVPIDRIVGEPPADEEALDCLGS